MCCIPTTLKEWSPHEVLVTAHTPAVPWPAVTGRLRQRQGTRSAADAAAGSWRGQGTAAELAAAQEPGGPPFPLSQRATCALASPACCSSASMSKAPTSSRGSCCSRSTRRRYQAALNADLANLARPRRPTPTTSPGRAYRALAAEGLCFQVPAGHAEATERSSAAAVLQAEADVQTARINLGYAKSHGPDRGPLPASSRSPRAPSSVSSTAEPVQRHPAHHGRPARSAVCELHHERGAIWIGCAGPEQRQCHAGRTRTRPPWRSPCPTAACTPSKARSISPTPRSTRHGCGEPARAAAEPRPHLAPWPCT